MAFNLFQCKPPITQLKLKEKYPKLSDTSIKQIDRKIKRSIAKDDAPAKVLDYVKTKLSYIKLSKHTFNQNCTDLAKVYIENSKHWMFQENLFCFFSLIVSIVWMMIQWVKLYNANAWIASDYVQAAIYLILTCMFLLLTSIRKHYKMETFDSFLQILNRYSPGAIMISTTACYVVICTKCELLLSNLIICGCLFLLICSIIRALNQLR